MHNRNLAEGSILRSLFTLSLPLLIGNFLQLFQQTINAFWIGRFLGKEAFSAVTVSHPVIFILVSFIIGITLGTTTLVSQFAGAKNFKMVNKVITNSFIFILLLSFIVSIIGIVFSKSIISIVLNPSQSPEVFKLATSYLRVTLFGVAFIFGFNLISAILRGLGDSWNPLWILIWGTIINTVLDPILILGIPNFMQGLGINGSALATILAQLISFILGIRLLQNNALLGFINIKQISYDNNLISKILSIGLPNAIQQIIVSTGVFLLTIIVSHFGINTITAFGIGSKIDSFTFMPSMAIGMATTILVGHNLGAGKKDRVRKTVKVASFLSMSITFVVIITCFIFPSQIIRFFMGDPSAPESGINEIIAQGTLYLRIVPIGYIGVASIFITNGVLRGAGDTIPPMIFAILSFWLIRIPLAYLLSHYTPLQSKGIWIAIMLGFIFSAIISYLYYKFGPWEEKVTIRRLA